MNNYICIFFYFKLFYYLNKFHYTFIKSNIQTINLIHANLLQNNKQNFNNFVWNQINFVQI